MTRKTNDFEELFYDLFRKCMKVKHEFYKLKLNNGITLIVCTDDVFIDKDTVFVYGVFYKNEIVGVVSELETGYTYKFSIDKVDEIELIF